MPRHDYSDFEVFAEEEGTSPVRGHLDLLVNTRRRNGKEEQYIISKQEAKAVAEAYVKALGGTITW